VIKKATSERVRELREQVKALVQQLLNAEGWL